MGDRQDGVRGRGRARDRPGQQSAGTEAFVVGDLRLCDSVARRDRDVGRINGGREESREVGCACFESVEVIFLL